MLVEKGANPFMKVGTGQGKSLIIALLAAHYAVQGRRVQVFACYSHLAKRDFDRFKKRYEDFSVEAALITDSIDAKYASKHTVVYSKLETFFSTRERCALKQAEARPSILR